MIKWLLKILGFMTPNVVTLKGEVDAPVSVAPAEPVLDVQETPVVTKVKKARKPRQRKASSKKSKE